MNKLTIAALLGALLTAPVMAAQYYKWIDENGSQPITRRPLLRVTAKNTYGSKGADSNRRPAPFAATESLQKQREAVTRKSLSEREKAAHSGGDLFYQGEQG
jgi:hypothetical protein